MARGRHPTRIHIDPPDELTAAKYFRQWAGRDVRWKMEQFPGLTSTELFGNQQPLEIDFGCGNGNLVCSRAQQYPTINMLGIDKSQKPLFWAVRDAAAAALDNVKFLRGDFNVMLPLLREATISAAYYLFPNPPQDYHKDRANAQRRNFLTSLHRALVPGGCIYFATDAPSFFECMHGIVKHDLHFNVLDTEIAGSDIFTKYRRKWEEEGRCVRSFVVEKDLMSSPEVTVNGMAEAS